MRPPARGAARRGLQASAIILLVGQVAALASYAADGWAYRPWTWVKMGLATSLAFCGVGFEAEAGFVVSRTGDPATVVLRYPLLVGTLLAAWLVYRAAVRSLDRGPVLPGADPGAVATAVLVAVSFAFPLWASSWLLSLRFPGLELSIAPVRWEAACWPLLLGAFAALAGVVRARATGGGAPVEGAVAAGPGGAARPSTSIRFVWACIAGGWWMLVWSSVAMFAVFLLAAATRPAAVETYVAGLRAHGSGGLAIALLHLAALPAQSIGLLVPAMGGVTLLGVPGVDLARMTVQGVTASAVDPVLGPDAARLVLGLDLPITFGLGTILLPAGVFVGTVAGGVFAARELLGDRDGIRNRMFVGAGAGVVFALLVAVSSMLARAAFVLPSLGFTVFATRVQLPQAVGFAAMWGIVGGAAGALLAERWRSGAR